eukprot:TRINITY_DN6383_c0_g1_i1.p1 TRINITY_DN6383_c0_g1~~TRINITY_DN6383_c0_g1_i1.p1  ORF type:complete len:292 (-),score=53.49 TRINITY_DN6383_c0_g1_i1:33-908(-)
MRDDFVRFWSESSKRWSNNPNILGYELINEPFAGDVFQNPDLYLPGIAGNKNLQPLYHYLQEGIRKFDQDTLVFYEPVVWGMLFDQKIAGSGFSQVPGGAEYKNRSVFSYHYYCDSFGGDQQICNNLILPDIMLAVDGDLRTLGGSSFMTEFGGPDCQNAVEPCVRVMEIADKHLQSWSLWKGINQILQPNFKNILSRTYATATAGRPISMKFDQITKEFNYCFIIDEAVNQNAPTEIFVQFEQNYSEGASIKVTSNISYKIVKNRNTISIISDGKSDGENACINISKLHD